MKLIVALVFIVSLIDATCGMTSNEFVHHKFLLKCFVLQIDLNLILFESFIFKLSSNFLFENSLDCCSFWNWQWRMFGKIFVSLFVLCLKRQKQDLSLYLFVCLEKKKISIWFDLIGFHWSIHSFKRMNSDSKIQFGKK